MSEQAKHPSVSEYFGCNVFNDTVMRERLPKDIYKSVMKTKQFGIALESDVADVVANAMKDWAVEKGATHYTHWFQPMTGITAEKHDAFITPAGDGKVILDFSGRSSLRVSRMLLPSPPAVCVPHLRQEATPPGILPPMRLSRTIPCASPQRSVPTPVRFWTRRHRCCVLWK